MSAPRSRTWLLVALLAVAAVMLLRVGSTLRSSGRRAATCDALQAGQTSEALAASEGLALRSLVDLDTAVCRCRALAMAGREPECTDLLLPAVEDHDDDAWLPPSDLMMTMVSELSGRRERARAASLARRAALAHPDSKGLLFLEWQTRKEVEPEQQVLADIERRLPPDPAAWPEQRMLLAKAHTVAGRYTDAIRVLGLPPSTEEKTRTQWYQTMLDAQAGLGDPARVRQAADAWLQAGADPRVVHASYVVALANHQMEGQEAPTVRLLQEAVRDDSGQLPLALETAVYIHYLYQLVSYHQYDLALEHIERAPARVDFGGFSREQVLAARNGERLELGGRDEGTLRFLLPSASVGGRLLVAPSHALRPDHPSEILSIPDSATLEIERPSWDLPYRWVVRDAMDRVIASGSSWVEGDGVVEVQVQPARPTTLQRWTWTRRPADGQRRLWLIVQDCMDWRIARYLMARGEMPVLEALLEEGYRTVLDSDPPVTAIAIDQIVHPRQPQPPTLTEFVYHIGVEMDVADLTPSGENPFRFLEGLVPVRPDLTRTIAAEEWTVANLLFSHGALDVGMNGEVAGPRGQDHPPLELASSRALRPEELERIRVDRAWVDDPHWAWVEEAAAVMDEVQAQAEGDLIDLMLVRTARLDTATHAHLADAFGDQDDGESLLFAYYRYLDLRTGQLLNTLDTDDYVIVMSDHSIRNAMAHDRPALFVMVGPDVPQGAGPGNPHISGVPRILAELLEVRTDWPDTGVAPWLTTPEG